MNENSVHPLLGPWELWNLIPLVRGPGECQLLMVVQMSVWPSLKNGSLLALTLPVL